MQLPDLKALNKLIALCRKQGIKVIKLGDMELTLSDDVPVKSSAVKAAKELAFIQSQIHSEGPSEDEMLFWSSTPGNEILKGTE